MGVISLFKKEKVNFIVKQILLLKFMLKHLAKNYSGDIMKGAWKEWNRKNFGMKSIIIQRNIIGLCL